MLKPWSLGDTLDSQRRYGEFKEILMSFMQNLFGSSKNKEDERTPIQVIEDELNVLLPNRFKQFLSEKLPKDNSIKIELLDGSYKFLDSLFRKDITDNYENVINVSNDLNSSDYPEEKDFVKIPFAKSTEGDGFKYLYFIAEKQKEASEKVILRVWILQQQAEYLCLANFHSFSERLEKQIVKPL